MLGLKIALAGFLAVLVPVYWRTYGPSNFLWVSDIGLFLTVAAVWVNHPLPLSMAVLTALPSKLPGLPIMSAGSFPVNGC